MGSQKGYGSDSSSSGAVSGRGNSITVSVGDSEPEERDGALECVSSVGPTPWSLNKDWKNRGPGRALYEDMSARAIASSVGNEPGRDARAFARVTAGFAEVHLVSSDKGALDELREAIRRRDIQLHEHLVERPQKDEEEEALRTWSRGELLPPKDIDSEPITISSIDSVKANSINAVNTADCNVYTVMVFRYDNKGSLILCENVREYVSASMAHSMVRKRFVKFFDGQMLYAEVRVKKRGGRGKGRLLRSYGMDERGSIRDL